MVSCRVSISRESCLFVPMRRSFESTYIVFSSMYLRVERERLSMRAFSLLTCPFWNPIRPKCFLVSAFDFASRLA